MGTEDHGRTAGLFDCEHLFHQLHVEWVESRKRFIQDDQIWPVNQSHDELHELGHPPRQCLDFLVPVFVQINPMEQFKTAIQRLRSGQSAEPPEVPQNV